MPERIKSITTYNESLNRTLELTLKCAWKEKKNTRKITMRPDGFTLAVGSYCATIRESIFKLCAMHMITCNGVHSILQWRIQNYFRVRALLVFFSYRVTAMCTAFTLCYRQLLKISKFYDGSWMVKIIRNLWHSWIPSSRYFVNKGIKITFGWALLRENW